MSAERGMTLLEIMIAVAVLGIAMMATFLAVVQGEQLAARSDEESLALQAAEQVVENLRAGNFSDFSGVTTLDQLLAAGTVEFTPCVAKGAGAGQAASEMLLQPHVDATGQPLPVGITSVTKPAGQDLTWISVTVQWLGDDPVYARTVTLRTKVAP